MSAPRERPPRCVHFDCRNLVAVDGDTVKLNLWSDKVYRVRLLDCWCPFERGHKRWKEAKQQMTEFISQAKEPSVFVPIPPDCDDVLEALTSLSRWHAHI